MTGVKFITGYYLIKINFFLFLFIYFKTKLIIILLIFLKWHQSTTWEFDESVTDFSSLQNTLGWLIDGTPTDEHLFIDDHMENLPLYNPEFT